MKEQFDREPLDPSPEMMRQYGYQLVDRLVDDFSRLSQQRVARRGTGQQLAALVDEPVPVDPSDIEDCLAFFFDRIVPGMTRVNHPRFHAYIPCPSSFAGTIGMMLAAGMNPFVGSWLGGATLAALELTVLGWIRELLVLDPASAGILTSGGSIANLIGMASARAKFGRSCLSEGVIYVSQEGHASVDKAASILGFAPDQVRHIEIDNRGKLDLSQLQARVRADGAAGQFPFFVCANAGTTNTGTIDDLQLLAEWCAKENLWFHVDAAYGGFAALAPEIRQQMNGIEIADSITLDPHKWLYCPMGVGCAFVRERRYLESAFRTHGSYLKDLPPAEVNFFDRGPELSRPARVLPVWMLLRSAGRNRLVDQIRTDIRQAELAANLLGEDHRLQVAPAQLSIVTFRHRARDGETESQRAARDDALVEATLDDGELMISSTTIRGINTLRLVVMNHRTTRQDIDRSVAKIRELAT